MTETFGKIDAERGDACSNSTEMYTSPCCYYGHTTQVTKCEGCGAPLVCETEEVTEYVCRIPYKYEERGDDER
jgi:hypothetical protein